MRIVTLAAFACINAASALFIPAADIGEYAMVFEDDAQAMPCEEMKVVPNPKKAIAELGIQGSSSSRIESPSCIGEFCFSKLKHSGVSQKSLQSHKSLSEFMLGTSKVTELTLQKLFGLDEADAMNLMKYMAELNEPRLVQLSENSLPLRATEGEKALLTLKGIRFMDITDELPVSTYREARELHKIPKKLSYSYEELNDYFAKLDGIEELEAFLTKFSSYFTRHYRSVTGRASQKFLLGTIQELLETTTANVTVGEFEHEWDQSTIIVRFEPSEGADAGTVILGAHQDSTNMLPFLRSPGADDDGSGTTTSLSVLKALVRSGFVPSKHPVEFHFYSAEEGGLLGSAEVARAYAGAETPVFSMLQMDMTAWVQKGTVPSAGVISDFVDADLTAFVELLVPEYTNLALAHTKCGYGCSDHASWNRVGARSSFIIESKFEETSHQVHSADDRIDYSDEFSFEHIKQYSQLALAYVLELAL